MRDQYIPDLTERFPEGFGGVDLTDKYFPSRGNYSDEDAAWAAFEEEYEQHMMEVRQFKVGDRHVRVGVFGGVTEYTVKEIDRDNNRILLSEYWMDVDGEGTRPAEWHELVTDENDNERVLLWKSERYGEFWMEAPAE